MTGYTVRTAPRPAGEGWRKVPSVTYGGAPFFWHRRTDDSTGAPTCATFSEWYSYDRIAREWRSSGECRVHGYVTLPHGGAPMV